MKKFVLNCSLLIISVCLVFALFGCDNKVDNHKKSINYFEYMLEIVGQKDAEFNEKPLNETQRTLYKKTTIEHLLECGSKQIFYVKGIKEQDFGDVCLIVLVEDNIITKIVPDKINEPHGNGSQCFSAIYLNNFIGLDLSEIDFLEGRKRPSNDSDIIYVSGATYTSKTLIDCINAIICYNQLQKSYDINIG